jgi:hypothetical protein
MESTKQPRYEFLALVLDLLTAKVLVWESRSEGRPGRHRVVSRDGT